MVINRHRPDTRDKRDTDAYEYECVWINVTVNLIRKQAMSREMVYEWQGFHFSRSEGKKRGRGKDKREQSFTHTISQVVVREIDECVSCMCVGGIIPSSLCQFSYNHLNCWHQNFLSFYYHGIIILSFLKTPPSVLLLSLLSLTLLPF